MSNVHRDRCTFFFRIPSYDPRCPRCQVLVAETAAEAEAVEEVERELARELTADILREEPNVEGMT